MSSTINKCIHAPPFSLPACASKYRAIEGIVIGNVSSRQPLNAHSTQYNNAYKRIE